MTSRSSSSRIAPGPSAAKIGAQLAEDSVTSLRGTAIVRRQDPLDAEANERQRRADDALHGRGPSRAQHIGGILAGRERRDAHLEAVRLDHLGGLEHRSHPRPVGVEREHDRRRQAAQLGGLLVGQRRAHQPHAVAHTGLVGGDHVGVALAEHRRPGASRRRRARGASRTGDGPCGRSRRRRC